MMDRAKVIGDLEEQIAWIRDNDFYKFPGWGHTVLAMRDALALLKAQEPVEPIRHYVPDGKRSSVAWQCGGCLIDIGYGVNYCYNCGMPVKWE